MNDTREPIAKETLALNKPQKPLIIAGVIVGFILLVYLSTKTLQETTSTTLP